MASATFYKPGRLRVSLVRQSLHQLTR
jgi:hypothetical protein